LPPFLARAPALLFSVRPSGFDCLLSTAAGHFRHREEHQQPLSEAQGLSPCGGPLDPHEVRRQRKEEYPTTREMAAPARCPDITAVTNATINARKIGPLG